MLMTRININDWLFLSTCTILTWVFIYWFSRAGPEASLRTYYEVAHSILDWASTPQLTPAVLVGVSLFPKELCLHPITWLRTIGNVVFVKEYDSGAHFAAYERPNELVVDLKEMFGKKGPTYKVVKGHSGYVPSRVRSKL